MQHLYEMNDALAAVYPPNQPLSQAVACLTRGEAHAHSNATTAYAALEEALNGVQSLIDNAKNLIGENTHIQSELQHYESKVNAASLVWRRIGTR